MVADLNTTVDCQPVEQSRADFCSDTKRVSTPLNLTNCELFLTRSFYPICATCPRSRNHSALVRFCSDFVVSPLLHSCHVLCYFPSDTSSVIAPVTSLCYFPSVTSYYIPVPFPVLLPLCYFLLLPLCHVLCHFHSLTSCYFPSVTSYYFPLPLPVLHPPVISRYFPLPFPVLLLLWHFHSHFSLSFLLVLPPDTSCVTSL